MDHAPAPSALDAAYRLTQAVGQPRSAADTLVRVLQRNDPPLYPIPKGRGGGKNAAPHTLEGGTNLLLGFLISGPAIHKPVLIPAYRAIPSVPGAGWPAGIDPERSSEVAAFLEAVQAMHKAVTGAEPDWPSKFQLIPGTTLGEALDALVDWLSRPEGQTIRQMFRVLGFWWDFGTGFHHPPCSAGCSTKTANFSAFFISKGFWPTSPDTDANPGITVTARVHFEVFEVLADLWAAARPRQVGSITPSSSGSALPTETERKSGGHGGTNTAPPLPLDRPSETRKAGQLHTREGSARARCPQAHSVSGNGPRPELREDLFRDQEKRVGSPQRATA